MIYNGNKSVRPIRNRTKSEKVYVNETRETFYIVRSKSVYATNGKTVRLIHGCRNQKEAIKIMEALNKSAKRGIYEEIGKVMNQRNQRVHNMNWND